MDRCIKTGLMHETRLFSINKTQRFQKKNFVGVFPAYANLDAQINTFLLLLDAIEPTPVSEWVIVSEITIASTELLGLFVLGSFS